MNDELPAKHTGYIIDDNYGGAKKMMAHLIDECGYQSVAFVSNRLSHTSNMLRYIGYLDALDERKLQPYRSSQLPQYDLVGRVKEYNRTPLSHFGLTEIPRRGSHPNIDLLYTAGPMTVLIIDLLARPRCHFFPQMNWAAKK